MREQRGENRQTATWHFFSLLFFSFFLTLSFSLCVCVLLLLLCATLVLKDISLLYFIHRSRSMDPLQMWFPFEFLFLSLSFSPLLPFFPLLFFLSLPLLFSLILIPVGHGCQATVNHTPKESKSTKQSLPGSGKEIEQKRKKKPDGLITIDDPKGWIR